jgi:hypothetical protein
MLSVALLLAVATAAAAAGGGAGPAAPAAPAVRGTFGGVCGGGAPNSSTSTTLLMQQGLCYALPGGAGDAYALCDDDGGGGVLTAFEAGSSCVGAATAAAFAAGVCLPAAAGSFDCSAGAQPLAPPVALATGYAAVLGRSDAACAAAQSDYLTVAPAGSCVAVPAPAAYGGVAPPLIAASTAATPGGALPLAPTSLRVACNGDGAGGVLFVSIAACTAGSGGGGGVAGGALSFVNGACLTNPYASGPAALQAWCTPAAAPPALSATLALSPAACSAGIGGSPASAEVDVLVAAPAGACAPLPGGLGWRVACDGAGAGAWLELCADGSCSAAAGGCAGVRVAAADGSCAPSPLPPGWGGAVSLALTCSRTAPAPPPPPSLPAGAAALSLWPAPGCAAPGAGTAATDAVVHANACLRLPGAAFVVGCAPGGGGSLSVCDAACGTCAVVAAFDAPAAGAASACLALPAGAAGGNTSVTITCGASLAVAATSAAPPLAAATSAALLTALAGVVAAGAW